MTIPTTPPGVKLYPHEPTSFLPLLRAHLPHSITTYSTIRTNPWPRIDIPPGVSLSASSSLSSGGSKAGPQHANGSPATGVPDSLIYGAVWATFPASQISDPPEIWAMLIHLPVPQRYQTRSYCSLDRELLVAPRSPDGVSTAGGTLPPALPVGSPGTGGAAGLARDSLRWRAGQALMLGVVQTVVLAFPPGEKYIPLNTAWVDRVVDWLKDVELATMVHDAYDVWLAPEEPSDGGMRDERGEGSPRPNREGLEVGPCRREDCEAIQSSREIKEDIAYYIARMDHTSVVRRSDTGEPVAWILTHAAGDLGALYTVDGYRRRGLAKWVVEERLRAGKTAVGGEQGSEVDDALRGHVWVSWENVGSRRLWESMGWVRGWSARWVCVK